MIADAQQYWWSHFTIRAVIYTEKGINQDQGNKFIYSLLYNTGLHDEMTVCNASCYTNDRTLTVIYIQICLNM